MNPPTAHNTLALREKSFIERAFPVPRSLILSSMAVDISDGRLCFFELNRNRGVLSTKAYGSVPFPSIHLGSLTEKSRQEAITALTAWATAQKCSSARVVIHEDEAYVFKVTVPTLNKREMRASIESVLEENVPVHPSEAVFEFEVISRDVETQSSVVAVSVISKKTAGELIDLFAQSGVQVVSIETEARALTRALFKRHEEGVRAVISIAEHHTVIFIVERGAVVFSSTLEVGSVDLDQAIGKEFGITEPEARKLKLERAFTESDGDMKLFEAMAPIFSIIQDELGKMIVYWRTQSKKEGSTKEISNIVLCGSDALIAGFSHYISINSKIPAKTGSVWTNILPIEESIPEILYRDSFEYGTVIGTLI